MTDWMKDREEIDPHLDELLGLLKEVPPRSPHAGRQGLARFVAEIDAAIEEENRAKKAYLFAWLPAWFTGTQSSKEKSAMSGFTRNPVWTFVTVLILLFAFLFGGASVTARASQSALPGDALYPVKTGLEQARLSMTRDLSAQAELHLALAHTRLDEINALVAEGRYDDIPALAVQFQESVDKALAAIQALAAADPARAAQLNLEISAALADFNANLANVMSSIPAQIRNQVQEAIGASQDAPPAENTNQGLENTNDDISDDNANAAGSGNANGDDNSNGGANTNDDSNVNCSLNDNQPGCEGLNANDGGNANGSDDGGNTNGSDDGGNANGSDDGGNTNGSDDGGNTNGSNDNSGGEDRGGGRDDNGGGGGGGGNDGGDNSGGSDDSVHVLTSFAA